MQKVRHKSDNRDSRYELKSGELGDFVSVAMHWLLDWGPFDGFCNISSLGVPFANISFEVDFCYDLA